MIAMPMERVRAPATNAQYVLVRALDELSELLLAASDEQYTHKPVGVIPSSLGGHIRHCLDHFEALLAGASTGRINYDHRARGTTVELDRRAALDALEVLKDKLLILDESSMRRAVRVTAMLAGDGSVVETTSSFGREMVFVLSHTLHHNALVAAMCKVLGIAAPERFGYAPATIAHLDRFACAPSPLSR